MFLKWTWAIYGKGKNSDITIEMFFVPLSLFLYHLWVYCITWPHFNIQFNGSRTCFFDDACNSLFLAFFFFFSSFVCFFFIFCIWTLIHSSHLDGSLYLVSIALQCVNVYSEFNLNQRNQNNLLHNAFLPALKRIYFYHFHVRKFGENWIVQKVDNESHGSQKNTNQHNSIWTFFGVLFAKQNETTKYKNGKWMVARGEDIKRHLSCAFSLLLLPFFFFFCLAIIWWSVSDSNSSSGGGNGEFDLKMVMKTHLPKQPSSNDNCTHFRFLSFKVTHYNFSTFAKWKEIRISHFEISFFSSSRNWLPNGEQFNLSIF